MFDIGFWELVIISIVALLVVGPERLPGLIRDVGRWVRAIRRFVVQTRQELERELDFEEEKNLLSSLRDMDELMDIAPDREKREGKRAGGTNEQQES